MNRTTPDIRLFCSDLDGTLLGNPEASLRFKAAWESLPPETRPLLVYNSGRTVGDVRRFVTSGLLPSPDFIIGTMGTRILDCRTQREITEFRDTLAAGWDGDKVREVLAGQAGAKPQTESHQDPFMLSWSLATPTPERVREIGAALQAQGLSVQVFHSEARDLDVVPTGAGKGPSLAWLCRRLGIDGNRVLVCGDSGNDAPMFRIPGVRGVIVENARPELFEATVDIPVFTAHRILADGVIDGLREFGVITGEVRAERAGGTEAVLTPGDRMLFTGTRMASLTGDEKQLLCTAYERALDAVRRNITPMGFSACSLKDNAFKGTDVNYRSVWARDGSITVISTLDIDDADIRQACRATLDTLLKAISPTGQIPANVRIDDGVPDYSGVGNICSIDSGLWVVIAVYNYIVRTRDMAFLEEHADRLQAAMHWLSAIDSNNDGLLEIPEAGDWTDLFGRSYNVLYDEVLWYRANVCFGRLLEFRGKFDRAGEYLRTSRHIRSRVLEVFWPTTGGAASGDAELRFASRQFELGDARYLLAEITPFSFNWRCDVFGNVLAYLMNLLDVDRARTAFRFMWGVGVNSPFPVANLYPVVQAGDPDWKSYYTVNLLNLPQHYHNGGVWPFIGGMWVRFIHRLGYHDVACRELLRLAELNRQGRDQEWEFNEWCHGGTGRPMGKAFQAWSAASFLKACHELETAPDNFGDDLI